jgi:dTDP-4-dehydrorhamnose reductase
MILITGAHGQVGQCFQRLAARFPQFDFLFAASADLDITDSQAVSAFFDRHRVGWCVNCAAYTAVDRAETEKEKAYAVNVRGPRNLARACARSGATLIHLSTDYVYHTCQNTPYREDARTSPKSVYARTKLAGERTAQGAHALTMIVRTSWVYAAHGHNFVRTMLRLGAERPWLNVVADQIGTPTYAPDLAEALLTVIHKVESGAADRAALAGIWHYSNEGVASWYDFAVAIMELAGLPARVCPIDTAQFPTPASRPPFSVLNKAKMREAFGLEIPHWRASLQQCLQDALPAEARSAQEG